MKLIKAKEQPAKLGFKASRREWWEFDEGYEAYVIISNNLCNFWITAPNKKDITYDVAKLLKLDVSKDHLVKRYNGDDKLYASMSINCLTLNYTEPENYKLILKKIEEIITEHLKYK